MKHFGDHDGKAKTSSAGDSEHYPDGKPAGEDTHSQIALLAYRMWEENGCPAGSEERDWLAAERQLLGKGEIAVESRTLAAQAGSVQR